MLAIDSVLILDPVLDIDSVLILDPVLDIDSADSGSSASYRLC